tara:strand:+ start:169 stop:627 length:459 start_codon:yes stop_codon:yes gene_type:complete
MTPKTLTIEEKIKKLLSVTGRLSKILKQENEILNQPGMAEGLKELVEEKNTLSTDYEQRIKIVNDDEDLSLLDPGLRRRLTDALTTFGVLLDENTIKIRARMEATERLFLIISEAAKSHQNVSSGYVQTGAMRTHNRQAYIPAVSVSINQEL